MSVNYYDASTKKLKQIAGNLNAEDIEDLKDDVDTLFEEKANKSDVDSLNEIIEVSSVITLDSIESGYTILKELSAQEEGYYLVTAQVWGYTAGVSTRIVLDIDSRTFYDSNISQYYAGSASSVIKFYKNDTKNIRMYTSKAFSNTSAVKHYITITKLR